MSLNVINKYVSKKERDLLDYAKILEEIITIDDNKMWKNKKEFGVYAKEIIKIYAEEYYFDNNTNRDNPIEYSNDNINYVLKSIINYCKQNDMEAKLKDWKNELFLLSVIICTSCYVDFATNVIDGDFTDTKNKFKYLLSYLQKTKILHVSTNKYWINDLFDLIKKSRGEDARVFELMESEDFYNEYIKVTNEPAYYVVNYKYKIPGLSEYTDGLVAMVSKSYNPKLMNISYELLSFHVLKELISNRDMGMYLLNIDKDLKRSTVINNFDNKYLKKYVKILVPFDEEVKYQSIIKEYRDRGIGIVYDYKLDENINSKIFDEDSEILVTKEFIKNNVDNEMEFDKKKIKLVVKNKED